MLLLSCERDAGGNLLARTREGLSLRLPEAIHSARDLKPGDTLLARVISSDPVLELELQTASRSHVPSGPRALSEHVAMRLDQAALQQFIPRTPDAAALAASWRMLARSLAAGGRSGSADVFDASTPLVCYWSGVQVRVRAIESDHEDAPSRVPRRYRRLALLVRISSPALGQMELRVHWVEQGVALAVHVENAQAEQALQAATPAIAAAIARADLRLTRCRIVLGLAPAPAAPAAISAAALPPALFRAAAEAAVVILGTADTPGFTPASR